MKRLPDFHFFSDSLAAGDPDCRCSGCKRLIGHGERVVRIWGEGELRACEDCAPEAIAANQASQALPMVVDP